MKIPLGPFIALGKAGHELYSHFFKGPKIDASLTFVKGGQKYLGASEQNPTDRPVFVGDVINVFNFESEYELTLKNTSKSPAYNIKLVNAKDIFSGHDQLNPLTSLEPGESIVTTCWFLTPSVHAKSYETKSYHGIPDEKIGKTLVIAYDNEARTSFYTKFIINDKETHNDYSLKLPTL